MTSKPGPPPAEMNRRSFFRYGLERVGETVAETVAAASPPVVHWVAPPYALPEAEFLSACTRCGECREACPHDVIFELNPSHGNSLDKVPALDLLQHACHLCADWPCVQACAPGALLLPQSQNGDEPVSLPRFAEAHIKQEHCLPWRGPECGACQGSCPLPGVLTWQGSKPSIDAEACVGCGLCREACIASPNAVELRPFTVE